MNCDTQVCAIDQLQTSEERETQKGSTMGEVIILAPGLNNGTKINHAFDKKLQRPLCWMVLFPRKPYLTLRSRKMFCDKNVFSCANGMALGTLMSVGQSVHHFGPHWNISTTIGWIAITFVQTVTVPSGSIVTTLVTFHLVPSLDTNFNLSNTLVYNQTPAKLCLVLMQMLVC